MREQAAAVGMATIGIAGWRRTALGGLLGLLSGCAGYAPLPLDLRPKLRPALSDLAHPGLAVLPARLPVADVAYLAVENDPALRAARAQLGVARAQVIQAGILPNPVINAAYSPVLSGPGTTAAWSAGLSADLKALVTLSARRAAARAAEAQVNASLLWQEWQVIGKARLLAVDIVEGDRLARLLGQSRDLFAGRYNTTRRAVAQGNADLTALSPDLVALGSTQKLIDDLQRRQQTRRHQLAALLGLEPDATIPLSDRLDLPPIDPAAIERIVPTLAERRPDLIALQLGYRAEDEKLRAAILAQFPVLNVGFTGGSDNTNVHTLGPQITIDLPIFDRNQGRIAIARATRRQLHAEFTARLAAGTGEIEALLSEMALIRRQLGGERKQLAETERVAASADAAFRAGNLTELVYVDLTTARIDKRIEVLGLEQALLDQQVALATLVGAGMPSVALPRAGEGPRA